MHTTLAAKKDLQRVTTPELCPLPRPSRGLPVPRGASGGPCCPLDPSRRPAAAARPSEHGAGGKASAPHPRPEVSKPCGEGPHPIQGSGAPLCSHGGSKSKAFSRCLRFSVPVHPSPPPLASAPLPPSRPPVPLAPSLLAHDQYEDGSIPPPHHPTVNMSQYPLPAPPSL